MNPTSQYLRVLSVVNRSLNGNNRVSDETLVSMYTHKQFEELGVDSMDRLELIMHIEDEFNVQIPDGKTDEMNSADDIYQYLVEAAAIDPNADSEGKRIAIRQCAFQAWQEVTDIPVNHDMLEKSINEQAYLVAQAFIKAAERNLRKVPSLSDVQSDELLAFNVPTLITK